MLTKGEDAGKADKNGRHLKAYIRDMNSSNGTSVNNKLLQAGEERLLESGDVIRLGARVKNPFLPVIRYLAHPIASNQEEIKRFLKVCTTFAFFCVMLVSSGLDVERD